MSEKIPSDFDKQWGIDGMEIEEQATSIENPPAPEDVYMRGRFGGSVKVVPMPAEYIPESTGEYKPNSYVESGQKLWDVREMGWTRMTTSTGDQLVYEPMEGGFTLENVQTGEKKFIPDAEFKNSVFEAGKTQVILDGKISTVIRFEN